MMERIRDLLAVHYKNKKSIDFSMLFHSAESEGFEPPDLLQSTVFKTAAIDHSANSPFKFCSEFLVVQI